MDPETIAPVMWACHAVITTSTESGFIVKQTPTFYLNPHIQGILTEEVARSVAQKVIDPMNLLPQSANVTIHVFRFPLDK